MAAVRIPVATINSHLICVLCGGYLIDATTIVECLHTFCQSCLLKYMEVNKLCPICDVQVYKSKPLVNIRPDYVLQSLVYKLVPNLYLNEMQRRRKFYSAHPEIGSSCVEPESSKVAREKMICNGLDTIPVSMKYSDCERSTTDQNDETFVPNINLYCPLEMTVYHLKQFIMKKFGIWEKQYRVSVWSGEKDFPDFTTLWDVACSQNAITDDVVRLSYVISRRIINVVRKKKVAPKTAALKKSIPSSCVKIRRKSKSSRKRSHKRKRAKVVVSAIPSFLQEPESKSGDVSAVSNASSLELSDDPQSKEQLEHEICLAASGNDLTNNQDSGIEDENCPGSLVAETFSFENSADPSEISSSKDASSDEMNAAALPEEEILKETAAFDVSAPCLPESSQLAVVPVATSLSDGDVLVSIPSPEIFGAQSPMEPTVQCEALDLSKQNNFVDVSESNANARKQHHPTSSKHGSRFGKGQGTQTILSIAETLASRQLNSQDSEKKRPFPESSTAHRRDLPPKISLSGKESSTAKISITKLPASNQLKDADRALPSKRKFSSFAGKLPSMTLKIPKPYNHFPSLWNDKNWGGGSWDARRSDVDAPQKRTPEFTCRKLTVPAKSPYCFIPKKPNPAVRIIPNPSLLRHPRIPSSALLSGAASLRKDLENLVEDATLQQAVHFSTYLS